MMRDELTMIIGLIVSVCSETICSTIPHLST
jgi:hypothetical protein